jgi:archaeosortase B (VPXXXP-CTERM-specific)
MTTAATTLASNEAGRMRSRIVPAVVFVVVYALFESVVIWLSLAGALVPVANLIARVTGTLAGMTGVPNTVLGNDVFLSNRVLLISLECTGLFILGVFGALVLAYPASWGSRLVGLAVGIPVLIAANLLRLVAAAHVAVDFPEAFTIVHDYVFQVGMVLVAVGLWAAWMRTSRPPGETAPGPAGETLR